MRTLKLIIALLFVQGASYAQITSSHYVRVDDSTHLAVDVHLPNNYSTGKLPVLMVYTRYWRSAISRKTGEMKEGFNRDDKYFSENGFVIVKVDARGSGASFGQRLGEYSPAEVKDASAVLDWIVAQPWSDGNIGSYGVSYEGTTAELLCATNHPAVKAVVPGWSDFDVYRSPARPYGMLASGFIKKWSLYVGLLDKNAALFLGQSVKPVTKDSLKLALKEHKKNPNIYKITSKAEYRDSKFNQYTYAECAPFYWKDEIEKSNVPMLILTSWMDAGTAEGTLYRLQNYSNPQKVLMMATSHGGWSNASPFEVGDSLIYPKPGAWEQLKMQLDFFNHHLKGEENSVSDWPTIRYYNMGEEVYHESNSWPVSGTEVIPYYFNENGLLASSKPTKALGSDDYKIDYSTTTGKKNRWATQMGGPVLHLNDRGEMDDKMLTYTTEPMVKNLQITGTPIITLNMSSTHSDGAIFVYLEDVDENGVSRYITEGGLRLIHRKIDSDTSNFSLHSFNEADASLMEPGKMEEISFQLWPTSVMIKKGHSLRVAIAGADKDTFDKFPKRGKPTITILRNAVDSSFIMLPVVEGGL